jgi:plasmid stabilization system protein ParE
MALEVIWSPKSVERFDAILDYLQENWTEREMNIFIRKTFHIIGYISENPKMFRRSDKHKNIHEAIITRQVMLIYKIKSDRIELLTFWDTRQHPRKKFRN